MGTDLMTATFTGLDSPSSGDVVGTASQSSVFERLLPRAVRVLVLREREVPGWLPYVLRRLNDLASRYCDEPTEGCLLAHPDALERSLHVLGELLPDTAPAPSVVPTLDGGIQFVWHRGGWDLEIEVLVNRTETWGRNRETGERFAGAPEQARSALEQAFRQIEASPRDSG